MGALLQNKANKNQDKLVNWRTWRPTLAIFRELDLFNEQELTLMMCNVGVEVEKKKAALIATFIREQVLTNRWPGGALADPELTDRLGDLAYREWLQRFVNFCDESDGFYVG